jgi:hypothetical protein
VPRVSWIIAIFGLLVLSGCGQVFELTHVDSREEMVKRASLVVVGVIEKQALQSRMFYRASVPDEVGALRYWRVLRRRLRVETVLQGAEANRSIEVFEVYWTGGATGNWNATHEGQRAVFLLRQERGHYRVVQDWRRSIFPVASGPHEGLPLDATRPLWERIALMNYWMPRAVEAGRISYPYFTYSDPGVALSEWRVLKLLRGLVRHPSSAVRVPACRELLSNIGQDECWEKLSDVEQAGLRGSRYCCSAADVALLREKNQQMGSVQRWKFYPSREERRLLTTNSNRSLRSEFCKLYKAEYGEDPDTGCPATLEPPATIVTKDGDVPLPGAWPR